MTQSEQPADGDKIEVKARGFEELMDDLERIVRQLDGGEVELEEALALFERGVVRLRAAAQLLDGAHGRVEELIEASSGDLTVIGFDAPRPDAGAPDVP